MRYLNNQIYLEVTLNLKKTWLLEKENWGHIHIHPWLSNGKKILNSWVFKMESTKQKKIVGTQMVKDRYHRWDFLNI